MSLGFVRHSWCPAMPSLARDKNASLRLEPIIWDDSLSFLMEANIPRISSSFNILISFLTRTIYWACCKFGLAVGHGYNSRLAK